MPSITLSLTEAELREAVREWVERRGYTTSDRFWASFDEVSPVLPHDGGRIETRVTGVFPAPGEGGN